MAFTAVTRVKGEWSPAYYFSGDFNNYVARVRFSRFLFAKAFYRTFSCDREGGYHQFLLFDFVKSPRKPGVHAGFRGLSFR